MPPTNPIGEGTANVTVNMSLELKKRVKALAEESGMSQSAYLKAVIQNAVEAGDVFDPVPRKKNKTGD